MFDLTEAGYATLSESKRRALAEGARAHIMANCAMGRDLRDVAARDMWAAIGREMGEMCDEELEEFRRVAEEGGWELHYPDDLCSIIYGCHWSD